MASVWKKMTVLQLKTELKKRGLEDSGRKIDLIERISKHADRDNQEQSKPVAASKSIFDEPPESDSENEQEDLNSAFDEKVNKVEPTKTEKCKTSDEKKQHNGITEKEKSKTSPEKVNPDLVSGNKQTEKSSSVKTDVVNNGKKPNAEAVSKTDISVIPAASVDVKPNITDVISNDKDTKTDKVDHSNEKPKIKTEKTSDDESVSVSSLNVNNVVCKTKVVKMEVTESGGDSSAKVEKVEEVKSNNEKASPSAAGEDVTGVLEDESKKWIDIMDCAKNEKILEELEKIGKVEAFKNRQKEHEEVGRMHKIRIFPLSVKDLADPFIQDIINKAKLCNMKYGVVEKEVEKFGWLMAVFRTRAEVNEAVAAVKKFREDMKVYYATDDKPDKANSWHTEWAKFVSKPDPGDLSIFRLFVPSLPQTINEEDMWNIFPAARDIILVNAVPRKHAYIHFWNEKAVRQAIDELNAQGPPREDFQFCRLLRQGDLHKLIMASASSGTDNKQATKGTESAQQTNRNVNNETPQTKSQRKPPFEARGKPKNLMNIHLQRPLGSGRRPRHRRVSRTEHPPYNPSSHDRNEDPRGTLQNTFAQLQTQDMDKAPQVIDTLQTLLFQVNQSELRNQQPSRAPQHTSEAPGLPKPLMDAVPEEPLGRGMAPMRGARGRDRSNRGSFKRSHSPAAGYINNKRPCDKYFPRGNHSGNFRGRGQRRFNDFDTVTYDHDHRGGMQDNFTGPGGMMENYQPPGSCAPDDFAGNGNFNCQNDNRMDYGMGRQSHSSSYQRGGGGFQRGHQFDGDGGYQRYDQPCDNEFKPAGSYMPNIGPANNSGLMQPDHDYRAPDLQTNNPFTALLSGSKFKTFKDSFSLRQCKFSMGDNNTHRGGSYY